MTRPRVLPDWATSPTYSAGLYPGQANKNQPPAGIIAEGFDPGAVFVASWINWVLSNDAAWIDHYDSIFTDHDFWFADDFLGSAVDTSKWIATGSPPLTDDSANGGYGTIRFTSGGGSLLTQNIAITTGDFIWATRFRVNTTPVQGTNFINFGIENILGTNGFYFGVGSSPNNWDLVFDAASVHATGLALSDHNYHTVRCMRINGTFTLLIDGTVDTTFADTFSLGGRANFFINTVTPGDIYFDYFKAWAAR